MLTSCLVHQVPLDLNIHVCYLKIKKDRVKAQFDHLQVLTNSKVSFMQREIMMDDTSQ